MKTIIMILVMITGLTSCDTDDDTNPVPSTPQPENVVDSNNMKITIGSTTFNATLASNQTAVAFIAMLPMTINMSELNNNEKYYGLPQSLPTNASNPGTIQNGDLMLYGSNTLVLFYKTFSTSYSYTRIGNVDNPSGLQSALGGASVTVTFELAE